jgi:hypothetical protein
MLRFLAAVSIVAVCLITSPASSNNSIALAAKCVGANPCKACKNCKYCQHCAVKNGTCGICKRR